MKEDNVISSILGYIDVRKTLSSNKLVGKNKREFEMTFKYSKVVCKSFKSHPK